MHGSTHTHVVSCQWNATDASCMQAWLPHACSTHVNGGDEYGVTGSRDKRALCLTSKGTLATGIRGWGHARAAGVADSVVIRDRVCVHACVYLPAADDTVAALFKVKSVVAWCVHQRLMCAADLSPSRSLSHLTSIPADIESNVILYIYKIDGTNMSLGAACMVS